MGKIKPGPLKVVEKLSAWLLEKKVQQKAARLTNSLKNDNDKAWAVEYLADSAKPAPEVAGQYFAGANSRLGAKVSMAHDNRWCLWSNEVCTVQDSLKRRTTDAAPFSQQVGKLGSMGGTIKVKIFRFGEYFSGVVRAHELQRSATKREIQSQMRNPEPDTRRMVD